MVETRPAAPEGNAGGFAHTLGPESVRSSIFPVWKFVWYWLGSRPLFSADSQNPVSFIASGWKMRVMKKSANGCRDARATRTLSTSDPVLYCHLSPGWYMSGSVAKRLSHSSGLCGVRGSGGPMTSSRSRAPITIGYGGTDDGRGDTPRRDRQR